MLPNDDRLRVYRGFMRYLSSIFSPIAVEKSVLKSAVDATDEWIENNQSSYNAALPPAARNNLTVMQKTLLFCAVAIARQSPQWLRIIFGEVD